MDVLEMVKGTAVWPHADAWDSAVLALEISEEAPSPDQVTYWLRNYAATGVLDRIGAMLFSRPLWYSQRDTLRLYDAVRRVLVESGRDDVPLVVGLDHGHGSPMGVLPLGCRARVDPTPADDRGDRGRGDVAQHPTRRWASQASTWSSPIRSWAIESRWRTVTARSSSVSKSTVTQNGVPTSS